MALLRLLRGIFCAEYQRAALSRARQQAYIFIMRHAFTFPSSTHSVVASYKPPMLVTGARFPVCAFHVCAFQCCETWLSSCIRTPLLAFMYFNASISVSCWASAHTCHSFATHYVPRVCLILVRGEHTHIRPHDLLYYTYTNCFGLIKARC